MFSTRSRAEHELGQAEEQRSEGFIEMCTACQFNLLAVNSYANCDLCWDVSMAIHIAYCCRSSRKKPIARSLLKTTNMVG